MSPCAPKTCKTWKRQRMELKTFLLSLILSWNTFFFYDLIHSSRTIWNPASPGDITIFDTDPDGPVASALFILMIHSSTMSLRTEQWGLMTVSSSGKQLLCKLCVQKLLMKTFKNHLLIFIIYYKHTIIIPYTPFTNNILISFDHPLYNFKHLTFDGLSN